MLSAIISYDSQLNNREKTKDFLIVSEHFRKSLCNMLNFMQLFGLVLVKKIDIPGN